MKEDDPRIVYADIIDLPRHQSKKHPHMSVYDRAAQFAPFAALSGYDDMIREESRLTGRARNLDESRKEEISRVLEFAASEIRDGHHPVLTLTYFVPDGEKDGGEYVTYTGVLKSADSTLSRLIFYAENGISDGLSVEISGIAEVRPETQIS